MTVQYLGAGSPAVGGYSLVSGWWAASYVSSKLSINPKEVYPLIILYFIVFFLCIIFGKTWLYRDINSAPTLFILTIGVIQSILIISPVLFNNAVDYVINYMKLRKNSRSS